MSSRTVHALSYDPGIFEHLGSLRVHASFPHAWHIRSGNGRIVSVVVSRWNGPLTIRVSALPPITTESVATLRETGLEIGETVLSLDRARPWTVQTERFQSLDPAVFRRDLKTLRQQVWSAARGGLATTLPDIESSPGERWGNIAGSPTRGDATDAWLVRGRKEMTSLGVALGRQDRDATGRHAVGLLGLGPGLTPAGDDVLCGLFAGLRVLGRRWTHQRSRCEGTLATLSDCIVAEAPRRTTSLSSTLLLSATRGVAMEPLLHLLETAGTNTGMSGVDELLMVGHSSGSDMLTGALLAGATLVRWEELFGPAVVGSR